MTRNGTDTTTTELEHYGRKGMKWYQHIFGEAQSHAKYAKGKKSKKSNVEKKPSRAEKRQAKKAAEEQKRREQILRDPKQLYKYRNQFTREEIDEAMKTFEWEKRLRSYVTDKNESSVKAMEQGKRIVQAATGVISGGIGAYNQTARIVNTFKDGKKVPYIEAIPGPKKDEKKNKKDK